MISNVLMNEINKSAIRATNLYRFVAPTDVTADRFNKYLQDTKAYRSIINEFNLTYDRLMTLISNVDSQSMQEVDLAIMSYIPTADIARIKNGDKSIYNKLLLANAVQSNELMSYFVQSYINGEKIPAIDNMTIANEFREIMNDVKSVKNNKYYFIVDTETNSLLQKDRIDKGFPVQVAYIVLNQNLEPIYSNNYYIKPTFPTEPGALAVHGLTDDFLFDNGLEPAEVCNKILEDIGGLPNISFMAHNSPFDVKVMQNLYNFSNIDMPKFDKMIDTLAIARKLKIGTKTKNGRISSSVANVLKYYNIDSFDVGKEMKTIFNTNLPTAHNAMFDTTAVMMIYKRLLETEKEKNASNAGGKQEKPIWL